MPSAASSSTREQLLVLQLLVGEADDRLHRGLVAERVAAADLEHLAADEALDEREHVGVGAALHLAEQAPLSAAEELELVDEREPLGHELVGEIEAATAEDVAVDVPADALRCFDGPRVAAGVGGGGLHGGLLRRMGVAIDAPASSTRRSPSAWGRSPGRGADRARRAPIRGTAVPRRTR